MSFVADDYSFYGIVDGFHYEETTDQLLAEHEAMLSKFATYSLFCINVYDQDKMFDLFLNTFEDMEGVGKEDVECMIEATKCWMQLFVSLIRPIARDIIETTNFVKEAMKDESKLAKGFNCVQSACRHLDKIVEIHQTAYSIMILFLWDIQTSISKAKEVAGIKKIVQEVIHALNNDSKLSLAYTRYTLRNCPKESYFAQDCKDDATEEGIDVADVMSQCVESFVGRMSLA